METMRGEIALYLRALQGFPEVIDSDFESLHVDYVTVEVVLRFIPHGGDAGDARFLCIMKSLRDLMHLEKRVCVRETSNTGGQDTSKVPKYIDDYLETFSRPRFGSLSRETDHFLWRLESFLTATLATARVSHTIKTFFGHATETKAHGMTLERCLAFGAQDSNQYQETTVASGCSHREDIEIVSSGPTLVVWKFLFEEEDASLPVVFSAVWNPRSAALYGNGDDTTGRAVDPYSEEAMALALGDDEQRDERVTLQFPTQYTSHGKWIYGACVVPAVGVAVADMATTRGYASGGVVTLEWTNADAASIVSKKLQYQVGYVHSSQTATSEDVAALYKLFDENDEETEETERLAWLEEMLMASPVTTWPTEEQEQGVEDLVSIPSTHQDDVRVLELESKVFQLEEKLQAARQELKTTKSELEISSEIYKASLETISHLETTAAAIQRQPSRRQSTTDRRKPSFDDLFHSGDDHDDDSDEAEESEDEFALESEDEAEHEPVDAETYRLRGLVATFQEQCLWRSIETTESEKRSLLLEVELNQVDRERQTLVEQMATKDQQLEALNAENQKLKTQKAVLVKEVKRLQPYSQVNLATLVHEAEEARMMQRSLQAQLQALLTASPETDHPQSTMEESVN